MGEQSRGTTRVAAVTDLAKAARALKQRHGDLLRGEPSFTDTYAQRRAMDALDAARARLQGGEAVAKDQLSLDVS